jgi:hypothetical protein
LKLKLVLSMLALSASMMAADVIGKWKAAIAGQNGTLEVTYDFKQEGDKITGTASSQMGDIPISDVKVEGDAVTFTITTPEWKAVHKGTISGDEMKLKLEVGDRQMDISAKRSK